MTIDAPGRQPLPDGVHPFPHRHLLGIEGLQPWEIGYLLDEAEAWVAFNRLPAKRDDRLAGLTQINAFFENSTRTLLSFEIAGKRLGADVVNMAVGQSSVKKGETLLDTALTLNAMHPDVIVIRHEASGAVDAGTRRAVLEHYLGAERAREHLAARDAQQSRHERLAAFNREREEAIQRLLTSGLPPEALQARLPALDRDLIQKHSLQ